VAATAAEYVMDKPFVVFSGQRYYPRGGWEDAISFHSTLEEAVAAAEARNLVRDEDYGEPDGLETWETYADWWHVVDMRSQTVVAKSDDYRPDEDFFYWREPK
jgi:3-methyladenine DNA glycosylase AlkD